MDGKRRLFMLADLDCFFVEVERLHNPELRGRAVVVGGEPNARGVVAACSYEARKLGIRSAMPMGEAYKLAGGQVLFLHEGIHGNYSLYSRRIQDILEGSVPSFRAKSIDEFEMDLSGCHAWLTHTYGGVPQFAEHLRRRVRDEVGLPLSIGIASSRIVAKIASRHAKPDGWYMVEPGGERAFLGPHDVSAVPGIGPVTAGALRELGISRVEQLLSQPLPLLRQTFGLGMMSLVQGLLADGDAPDAVLNATPDLRGRTISGNGLMGHTLGSARSHETAAIGFGQGGRGKPKSIGHETTFDRDTVDPRVIERTLWRLTEDACRRLRAKGLSAGHITVKLRYSDFKTSTHGAMLSEPTDADGPIFARALELLREAQTRRLRIRLIGIRLEKLTVGASQGILFEGGRQRRERELYRTVDTLRDRFGRDSLKVGSR
jgi:DNA polymerase-4